MESRIDQSASFLLRLPTEIRYEIYEWLLLPEPFICTKGEGFHEPDDALHEKPHDTNETTLCTVLREQSTRNHANPQQPIFQDRATYSDLMLVCKTIHSEAAPLFFNKVTLFIKDPLQFANTFLRKLSKEKISSLRHLELSFACHTQTEHDPQMKIFEDFVTVFKTYRELGCLDSVTMTLSMYGHFRQIYGEPSLIFRPVHNYDLYKHFYGFLDKFYVPAIRNLMCKTGQALLKTLGQTQFGLSESVEEVYGSMGPNQNQWKSRCEVARVRLQRI